MDPLIGALEALADAAIVHLQEAAETKYGAVAQNAKELKQLAKEEEYEDVLNGDLPSNQYADIGTLDGSRVLVLDTDNIPIEEITTNARSGGSIAEYPDLVDAFTHLHVVADGFPIKDRRGISKVMKSEEDRIDEIINHYRGRIHRQLLPVLEEALVLRELDRVQGLTLDEVRDFRYEIGNQYSERGYDPQEAQYLVSFCSMGYLDKGDVFDQMYEDLVINGRNSREDYKDIFKRYVSNNPFAVFVRPRDMNVDDIIKEATDKASRIHKLPGSPEFVEICSKGNARDLVQEAETRLRANFDGEIEVTQNNELEQYILTLRPTVTLE